MSASDAVSAIVAALDRSAPGSAAGMQQLVARLIESLNRSSADIAVAHDGKRMQPVYSIVPVNLTVSLNGFLDRGGRKIDLWYEQHRVALADFSDCPETFRNINTTEQRDELQNEGVVS